MVRILGIDPGSIACGYSVIEAEGQLIRPLKYGTFRPGNKPLNYRLLSLSCFIDDLIAQFEPDELAIEEAFFFKNAKTALALGQVRGALILTAGKAGLTVYEYPPAVVKSMITGYGRAEKIQVQQMIKQLLRLDELPPNDAADALAIAVCRAWQR